MILLNWDAWPRPLRHLAILLLGGLLDWAARDGLPAVGPWLSAHEPLGPLAGALFAQLVLYAAPFVRTYGAKYAGGEDAGSARTVLPIGLAVVLAVGASAGPALAAHRRPPAPHAPAVTCPAGYALAELHVGGQRIEHGLDPVTHEGTQVIVQNDPAADPADQRYVVALACVRPLNNDERNAQFYGRSTPPTLYPFVPAAA